MTAALEEFAECTGKKICRTRQDSRSRGRGFKQQHPEQETAKIPQRTETATPTGHSFNNKMSVESVDTRTVQAPNLWVLLYRYSTLETKYLSHF